MPDTTVTSTFGYNTSSLYAVNTETSSTFENDPDIANAQQQWRSLTWTDVSPRSTFASNNSSSPTMAELLAAATEPSAYFKLQRIAQSMGLDINNSSNRNQIEQWLLNLASSSTSNPFLVSENNSSSSDSGEETESAYSVIAREFRLFFYAIIFIICVFGNALVVITLAQNRRMRTVTNIFLINLAASDLLLGVFCMPFTLIGAMLREWIFGEFMCRAMSYFQCCTVVTSAVTLVCISLERYFAICRPLQSRRWQTKSHAYMMCIFCWLFGLICALPIPILSQLIPMVPPDVVFDVAQYKGPYKCREVYPHPQWIYEFFYQLFLSFCILVIPLILMVGFYTLITLELYRDISVSSTTSNGGVSAPQPPLCNVISNASSSCYQQTSKLELNSKVGSNAELSPNESEASSPIRAIRCSRSRQSVAGSATPPHQHNQSELLFQQNGDEQTSHRQYNGRGDHGNGSAALATSNGSSVRKKNKRTLTSFSLRQQPSLDSVVTTTTDRARGGGRSSPFGNTATSTRTTICSSYSTDKLTDGLRSTHTERNLATKKKVIVMLITVVIEFFICFTPITIFNLVAIAAPSQAYLVPSWGISFIQLLMYISTCCNPITYCFLNKKFREGFKFAFSCGKARRLHQLQHSTNQSTMTNVGSRANTLNNTMRAHAGTLTNTSSSNAGGKSSSTAVVTGNSTPTKDARKTTATKHGDYEKLDKVTIC